jgi:hypothetical protein
MKREKRIGPWLAISSAMRPLRPGDLADIDIDLPAGALAHIEDLEWTPLVAGHIAAV